MLIRPVISQKCFCFSTFLSKTDLWLQYCPNIHLCRYMILKLDASWTLRSFSPAYTEFLSIPWSSSPTIWTCLSVFFVKYSLSSWARRVLPLHGYPHITINGILTQKSGWQEQIHAFLQRYMMGDVLPRAHVVVW